MEVYQQMTHPWHIHIGDQAPEIIKAVIEIPKDSHMKYELDKPSGLLKLDRVIYSSMNYPMNYGLVPQTYYDDGDPLDILVLCSYEIVPLCILDVRVIGMMHMEDENGVDDKILSVAAHDPTYEHMEDLYDLPQHQMDKLKNFFEGYKVLEHKGVKVGDMYGKEQAYACIKRSMKMYGERFGKNQPAK